MEGVIKISLFTIILVGISFLIQEYSDLEILHPKGYAIMAFMWFVYVSLHLSYYFLHVFLKVNQPMMPLIGLVVRLLASLFAIMFILMSGIDDKRLFAINFIAIYLFYVVFEITSLLSNLRRNSIEENNE